MFQFADAGDFAALIKRQRDVCKQLLPEPQILGYEEIFDKGQHGKQVGTGTSLNLIKVFGTVLSKDTIARKSNVVLALELQSAPDKIGDIFYYTSVVDPELEYLGPNKWDFTC